MVSQGTETDEPGRASFGVQVNPPQIKTRVHSTQTTKPLPTLARSSQTSTSQTTESGQQTEDVPPPRWLDSPPRRQSLFDLRDEMLEEEEEPSPAGEVRTWEPRQLRDEILGEEEEPAVTAGDVWRQTWEPRARPQTPPSPEPMEVAIRRIGPAAPAEIQEPTAEPIVEFPITPPRQAEHVRGQQLELPGPPQQLAIEYLPQIDAGRRESVFETRQGRKRGREAEPGGGERMPRLEMNIPLPAIEPPQAIQPRQILRPPVVEHHPRPLLRPPMLEYHPQELPQQQQQLALQYQQDLPLPDDDEDMPQAQAMGRKRGRLSRPGGRQKRGRVEQLRRGIKRSEVDVSGFKSSGVRKKKKRTDYAEKAARIREELGSTIGERTRSKVKQDGSGRKRDSALYYADW